jgi:signal transduction histidine kinase
VSLLVKLVLINTFVIGVGMLVVWLSIDILAADYATRLMHEFAILPAGIHWVFLSTVHRYLMWSALVALGLAALFSFLMTRQVLRPLRQMREVAATIAAGDCSRRVTVETHDEIAQLADDLNRMAESLQRIEQFRRNLVADVAHELRTPLTNMRGYLEGLIDGVVAPDAKTLAVLQEETLRLVALVEDLLRLSDADAGAQALQPREVDAAETVGASLRLIAPRIDEKALRVQNDLRPGTWRVRADPDKLVQIVHNIMDNAVRYTPHGGAVRIGGRRENADTARFTFTNDCDAPPAGDFALCFERFYRGEKSRSRDYGGAGIGLAIVKTLVEAHGGQVGGQVLGDRGVEVWFTLPVTKAENGKRKAESPPQHSKWAAPTTQNQPRITLMARMGKPT